MPPLVQTVREGTLWDFNIGEFLFLCQLKMFECRRLFHSGSGVLPLQEARSVEKAESAALHNWDKDDKGKAA
jgi:hypothetical protein